jgi:PadR family transcriptional regulator, regulatory protein AphA
MLHIKVFFMTLQFAILGLLTYAPMNGYNLRKIFDSSVNYFWSARLSQIYRELAALEKKGYVLSSIQLQDDRPDKKIYSITAAGERAFMDWLVNFPEVSLPPKRDEFTLRIFFGSKLEKTELRRQFEQFVEERENFKRIMTENKKLINEVADTLKMPLQTSAMSMRFIARRAQMTNQVLVEWARECIKEIDEAIIKEG